MNRDYYVHDITANEHVFVEWTRTYANGIYTIGLTSDFGLAIELRCTSISSGSDKIYIGTDGHIYGTNTLTGVLELFSIRPKIYTLYGVNDVNNTTITNGVWTTTYTTSTVLPGKWVRSTDNDTCSYVSSSSVYYLTWNRRRINLAKIIFLEEGLCVFTDSLKFDNTTSFKTLYPVYKKNTLYYETSVNIPSSQESLTFVSFLGELYRNPRDFDKGHMNYDFMDTRTEIESGDYNNYPMTITGGFAQEGSSNKRYIIPRYSVRKNGSGILPFTVQTSQILYQEKSAILPLKTTISRNSPWILLQGKETPDIRWIDPYVLCIGSELYRIPAGWEVHQYKRRGINLSSNNITITHPIQKDTNDYYKLTTESDVIAYVRTNQNSSSWGEPPVAVNIDFETCGGIMEEYLLLRNNATQSVSTTYNKKRITIESNILLNILISAGTNTAVYSRTDLRRNNNTVKLAVKYYINNVPIIPGCNFNTTTSQTSRQSDSPINKTGINDWSNATLFSDSYWRVESYNNWQTASAYTTNRYAFVGLYNMINAAQDGIVGPGSMRLTSPNYTPQNMAFPEKTILVDYGSRSASTSAETIAALKTEVTSKENQPNQYFTVITAYPVEE